MDDATHSCFIALNLQIGNVPIFSQKLMRESLSEVGNSHVGQGASLGQDLPPT